MPALYQEEPGGTFQSNGVFYDLNKLFELSQHKIKQLIATRNLAWVIETVKGPIDEARVERADYRVPLLVCDLDDKTRRELIKQHEWVDTEPKLTVDGFHRLVKAHRLGVRYLPYYYLTTSEMKIARIHPSDKPASTKW